MARRLQIVSANPRRKRVVKKRVRKKAKARITKKRAAPRGKYIIEACAKLSQYHFYYWNGRGYGLEKSSAKRYTTREEATKVMRANRKACPRSCIWARVLDV